VQNEEVFLQEHYLKLLEMLQPLIEKRIVFLQEHYCKM